MAVIMQESLRNKEPASAFPLPRYCFHGPSRHYYPFGNVPAEDFLENCIGAPNPSVLVLGCGDIRSCFYTLWKNFDSAISNAPKRFDGVRFVLNDCCAPVIARNVIFLYLCTQFCGRDEEDIKLLSSMWAIWYCHDIYPSHNRILNATLENLIKFADSRKHWSSHENPLHQMVQFTTSDCLIKVSKVWKMWLHREVKVNSEAMHKDRIKKQEKYRFYNQNNTANFMAEHMHYVYGEDVGKTEHRTSRLGSEVYLYYKSGSCYAEEVLGIQLPLQEPDINITMYERADGRYTCQHKLLPFQGYYHSLDFVEKSFSCEGSLLLSAFKVLPKYFDSSPYLANSVQQFCMWVLSSCKVLKNKNVSISFTFEGSDAIRYCQELAQKFQVCKTGFDVITTSNLIDHIGLPNLVMSCIPLLKDSGILVTTTMKMRQLDVTGEHFIRTCFGFQCELLPIVLGIRCVGYDGKEYSNPVFMKPSPPEPSHFTPGKVSTVRTFLWIKLPTSQKLIFPRLPPRESGNVTDALVNSVTSSSFALSRCGIPNLLCASIGIETAMAMLKCFISRFEDFTSTYEFWEPLCSALKETAIPFLQCLQTQMLLHNIHAHLTLSEKDCPLCTSKALHEVLGMFQLTIDLSTYDGSSFNFAAYIHKFEEPDANGLHMKALEGQDVHLFDCCGATSTDDFKVTLDFFATLSFSNNGYRVSLVGIQKTNFVNKVAIVQSALLKSTETSWRKYTFVSSEAFSKPLPKRRRNDFKVVLHNSDQSKSETRIVLARNTSTVISSRAVKTEKVSSTVVKISCGSLSFQFYSSFPIKYGDMKLRISQSSQSMTLLCQRCPYSVGDERPCFIVSPSHSLSIVPMALGEDMMERQAEIQISLKERERFQNEPFHKLIEEVPEMNVKNFLRWLFENVSKGFHLYSINSDDCCCLILVNNLLFDYNHKTPAIDLAFYFLPDSDKTFPKPKWSQLWEQLPPKYYNLTLRGCHFLKEVMFYFARRTNASLLNAEKSKYSILHAQGIAGFFTRAVIYYISIDPDLRWVSNETTISKCAHCKVTGSHLVKCTQCGSIQYCNLTCQQSHYSEHWMLCTYIKHGTYQPLVHVPFMSVAFQNFH